ncbi:fasciclin domain-containing protein [Salinibacter ruber]|uniref:Transforming growth factor-beta-induced protein n=1 Tax=Salinibacter ruber TaxID=146919 RepID=A0A9X2ZLY9_9BACT|nr:fasciclin domain-containing protein [Salinibacter ruber]MCS3859236.1 transforming growth factor-beta-induced protein [Salinibacter ruber]MCS3866170.1 transforming growth factor-beta-induced protein [Salinibacter ruber]MCS4152138.1 transforming growth factor-beta-induced protein [Salinibacter ruber]MCS4178376.1 transforming growth factor-beta-induced protein [Salinibacter ruber]
MKPFSVQSCRFSLLLSVGLALIVCIAACDVGGPAAGDAPERGEANNRTVAERIEEWGPLNGLEAQLRSAGLYETLNDEGSTFTVFATRLSDLSEESVAAADQSVLTDILQYHVVQGEELAFDDLSDGQTLETVSGDDLTVSATDTTASVNGAQIVTKDIGATNGLVHVVERTLLENQSLSTRLTLDGFTQTTQALIEENGGVPGDGPYTVFAPVDGGYGGFELETLVSNSDFLSSFIGYHVVEGRLRASDLNNGQTLETLSGNELQVGVDADENVLINGSEVVTTNLGATNGVVHRIGGALLQNQSIAGRTALATNYSNLEGGLNQVGLTSTLNGGGSFTVFAPQNGAFGGVDTDTLQSSNPFYRSVLEYHVVSGQALESEDLSGGQTLETVGGAELQVTEEGGTVRVNGYAVKEANVQASNGVIHGMGSIFLENQTAADRAALTSVLTSLEDLLQRADLYGALNDSDGTFTVFAPADGAFAELNANAVSALTADRNRDLLRKILNYHVVGGEAFSGTELQEGRRLQTLQGSSVRTVAGSGGVQVNGIPVTQPDLQTSNGIVHLIEGDVLLPSLDAVEQSVIEGYTLLEQSLTETDLRQNVKEANEITVFAPTNAAFQEYLDSSFGANSLADLTQAQIQEVSENLQYHVATEEVGAGAIDDRDEIPTLEGSNLTFTVEGDAITVEGASIQETNIQSTNGVIHQIDQVLVAPSNR